MHAENLVQTHEGSLIVISVSLYESCLSVASVLLMTLTHLAPIILPPPLPQGSLNSKGRDQKDNSNLGSLST